MHAAIATPARRHRSMPARGVVVLFVALADFVAAVYGADDAMLNEVLGACRTALDGRRVDAAAETQLLSLLSSSLQVRGRCENGAPQSLRWIPRFSR
jgi:hypothetical protein